MYQGVFNPKNHYLPTPQTVLPNEHVLVNKPFSYWPRIAIEDQNKVRTTDFIGVCCVIFFKTKMESVDWKGELRPEPHLLYVNEASAIYKVF